MLTIESPKLTYDEYALQPQGRTLRRGAAVRGEAPRVTISIGAPQVQRLTAQTVVPDDELEAFGELEPKPYWEFTRTERTPIRGAYRLSMIVKSPARFAARADFAVKAEIEVTKFGLLTYTTPASGVDALNVKLS